jgi:hypothetical protein
MPWTVGVIMLVLMMGSVALNYLLWTMFIDGSVDFIKINIEHSLSNIGDIGNNFYHFNIPTISIWGTSSGKVIAVNRIGPIPYSVLVLLTGGLLGDMWGTHISGRVLPSVRFGMEQGPKNSEYLTSCWKLFNQLGYAGNPPFITAKGQSRFYLYSSTALYWVFEGFYPLVNGARTKVVPEWVFMFLTPMAIAHWFMQDGSRQLGQGVSLATNSFSHADCLRLANGLNSLYGLKTSVISAGKPNQWRISVWKQSLADFDALVRPHMHPSMMYKLSQIELNIPV